MEFPRKSFLDEAIRQGKSEEYIKETLNYADALNFKGLPVLFSLVHLSIASHAKYGGLLSAIQESEKHYKSFYFQKKRGGKRLVQAPKPNLKKTQKYINDYILSHVEPHDSCYSFRKGRSIVDNASVHLNQEYIRTFDIKDFFTSIKSKAVYKIFEELGYHSNLSVDIAKLCTFKKENQRFLPQGSPASPAISNLALKSFDHRMHSYAIQNDLRYSRYADDFTFSGNLKNLPKISFIKKVLLSEKFTLNLKKVRTYGPNHNKRIVTGLMVSDKVSVPPKFKKEIAQHFYFIKKYGVRNHIEFINSKNGVERNYYYEWITGKLLFLKMVEPEIAIPLLEELTAFNWVFKNAQNNAPPPTG